ncbi:MAG: cyclic nucleotide-binding domain-containing protein [Planctomycetota bacterium]|nr:cyclic nucleotide-binding domain-containing protein [Planctomycetota bacterium]
MPLAAQQVDALLALPLFADVDDELLDGVRLEAQITDANYSWEDGCTPRDGFLRFVQLSEGDVVATQGELTTQFVVVLSGTVQCLQGRTGAEPYRHCDLNAGDWFGEISTISDSPALASYLAAVDAEVAMLDARLFKRLYAEDDSFRARIDDGYRANLGLHLRLSPLCKDLDDLALKQLEQRSELVSYEEGEVVLTQGAPCDDVFLVRTGGVAGYVERDGGERTIAFYKGNATFGEHALLSAESTWPASYRTLMQTSLIKLPKAAFATLTSEARVGLTRAANRLIGADDVLAAERGAASDVGTRSVLDELFVMVERESVKGGRALVIDQKRCVRCNMCVESCESVHDDGIPRLSKVGTPVATDEVLITACYHCDTPQCMLSCEYSAIRRDAQGRVRFEYDMCVGCAGCIDGCPYGVIRLIEKRPPPQPNSLLAKLPIIGKLFEPAAEPQPPEDAPKPRSVGAGGKVSPVGGKTIKCDLCAGLPFEACVYNCPTAAIVRKEPQSLFERRGSR